MNWRRINAFVAAGLTVFFFMHEFLGMLFSYRAVGTNLAFLVWVGVAFAFAHMMFCLITSRSMLCDTVRPASARKKRHLALKWGTGAALLVAAGLHAALGVATQLDAAPASVATPLFLTGMMAAVLLAVHAYTGVKSLTRDLQLPSAVRAPCRVAIILITAVACGALLANF